MKCPVCEHVSDKALLRCSECDSAFDREQLERLEHLLFLADWLKNQPVFRPAIQTLQSQLRRDIDAVRQGLGIDALIRQYGEWPQTADEIGRQLILLRSVVAFVREWREEQVIGDWAARSLRDVLKADIDQLHEVLKGRSYRTVYYSETATLDLLAERLHGWSQRSQWGISEDQRVRAWMERRRAALMAPEEEPTIEPVIEARPAQAVEGEQPVETPEPVSPEPRKRVEPVPLEAMTSKEKVVPRPAPIRRKEPTPRAVPKRPALTRPKLPEISLALIRRKLSEAAASGALLGGFLYLSAFTIVLAAAVLVVRFPDQFPEWAQIGFIALGPLAFYLFGWIIRVKIGLRQSGSVLTNIGSLLVAVDLAAVYIFGGLEESVSPDLYWLGGSLFCTLLYAGTAWRLPTEFVGYTVLIGLGSTGVASTFVLRLAPVWSVVGAALSGFVMLLIGLWLERRSERWQELTLAARRLPAVVLPFSQAIVLFVPGEVAWGQAIVFGLAAVGYGLLVRVHARRRWPGTIFTHAAGWSSVSALGMLLLAVNLPFRWLGAVAAGLSSGYLVTGRWMDRRLAADFPDRRHRLFVPYGAGFGLLAVGLVLGTWPLLSTAFIPEAEFWPAIMALLLSTAVLMGCAPLFRLTVFVLMGGGLFFFPFSAMVTRQLVVAEIEEVMVWTVAAWTWLSLLYLSLAVLLRKFQGYVRHIYIIVHLAMPAALAVMVALQFGQSTGQPAPRLVALTGVIAVYLVSIVLQDSKRHPALNGLTTGFVSPIRETMFLWPTALLIPFWMALLGMTMNIQRPWLGLVIAGTGLAYVLIGQALRRREATYRLPPHVTAYPVAASGIVLALGHSWPLLLATLTTTMALALLALFYRRVIETLAAAILFIWPFHLALELSPLPVHVYTLAYAIVGSVLYLAAGLALAPRRFRYPWAIDRRGMAGARGSPYSMAVWMVGYTLAGAAAVATVISRFDAFPERYPLVDVAVPLIVGGLMVFSAFHFRRMGFSWAGVALAALAYGQALNLARVPADYDATAWVVLASLFMLAERSLQGVRPKSWPASFRRPLITAGLITWCLGLALTVPDTARALAGGEMGGYEHLLTAQFLAAGVAIAAGRLYRSRWPLFIEPALVFFPVTLLFVAYGGQLFGQALTTTHYGLVWTGLAFVHLAAAYVLDQSTARYSHGLYLGGYGLLLLAVGWTVLDRPVFLWTSGISTVIAGISAVLVHYDQHRSWKELRSLMLANRPGVYQRLHRSAFLWYAAWLFPIWAVLFLAEVGLTNRFYWLGLAVPALAYLAAVRWLRGVEGSYAWPFTSASQVYTAAGLAISAPLTARFFSGGAELPRENATATAFMAVQAAAVLFYAVAAPLYRRHFFAHLASWLVFAPFTLGWIVYAPGLETVQFAWPWMGLAVVLLATGYLLDGRKLPGIPAERLMAIRYAHGPYLAGYLLALLAVSWSAADRLVNIYTLGSGLVVAALSQVLIHRGAHRAFDDFRNRFWRREATISRRTVGIAFLFIAAYGFPVWLTQVTRYYELPLAWRGTVLALSAPLYVALGLWLRRYKGEYTWPLYSVGYLLTAVGAMVAIDDERLFIAVLGLNTAVYAASAYIFRQPYWLYLSNGLMPVIFLLTLHYNDLLTAPWIAGSLMGLSFVYVAAGQMLSRARAVGKGIWEYVLPFYAVGYLISAIALAAASEERNLAMVIYSSGVLLYGLSAWIFRESIFLYPTAWLAAVPYVLSLTYLKVRPAWIGPLLVPGIVAYVVIGRWVFNQRRFIISSWAEMASTLTRPGTPFYLLAYAGSLAAIVVATPDTTALTAALALAAALYLATSILFRRAAWLYPAIFVFHLAVLFAAQISPSGSPAHYISLPFLAVTWVVALVGAILVRRFPPTRLVRLEAHQFRLRGRTFQFRKIALRVGEVEIEIGGWPCITRLLSPSWAQPFLLFAALDIILWQPVAMMGKDTALIVGLGFALLLGALASLWGDGFLVYGTVVYLLLGLGPWLASLEGFGTPEVLAVFGGLGLALYLISRLTEVIRYWAPFLESWLRPLRRAAIVLTLAAVIGTVPGVAGHTLATAASLGFAGALYLAIAYRGRYFSLGYLAVAMLEMSWILLLAYRQVEQPQLYAVPAGLYFLGLGFLERRQGRTSFANYLDAFGASVLLLTTFIQSLNLEHGFPYFVLLIGESLAILGWGVVRRVKVLFFAGMAAFGMNVVGQLIVVSIVNDVMRWIIILVAALLATATVVLLQWEAKRNFGHLKEWREVLEGWR